MKRKARNMNKAKKVVSVQLILLLLISVVFQTALCVSAETSDTSFQIKIVHTNDIHARVEENPNNKVIGMAKLKTVIDTYTAGADIGLTVDSGDLFHGLPIATLSDGEAIARLVKECGYDVMTPGNHDWSYGKDRLKELAALAGLDLLAGNVVQSDSTPFFDKEYYTEEVTKDGKTLKVGIFGVIDPEIYSSTAPANVAGLTFTDTVAYANKAAAELKASGCDIVIALSHTYEPAAVAASVNDVDIWLCGHEHMGLDTTVATPNGDTAYVIEDGYYLNSVGLLALNCTVNDDGDVTAIRFQKSSVDFDGAASYTDDAAVAALLTQIRSEQEATLAQTVGTSPAKLDGVWEHLRIGETNLGKAVAGAYLLETGADIAFENAGGIRASVPEGAVTYGDIINVSPYGNYIVTKKITGAQLKEVLETSLDIQLKSMAANESGEYDAWPQNSGSYLQFAGMTVTYNPILEKGKRVLAIQVGKEKLDENKLYTVATNNYVAVSSDYPALANAAESGEFSACDAALIQYFRQNSQIILENISETGLIATDKTIIDADHSGDSGNAEKPETTNPQTGDDTVPVAYAAICFLCTAVVCLLICKKRKKNETYN